MLCREGARSELTNQKRLNMAAVAGAPGGPPPPGGGGGPPGGQQGGGPMLAAGVARQPNGLTDLEEAEMALEEALSLLGEFVKGDSGKRTVFVNVMRKTYRPGYMVPEAHRRRWARQLKVPMRKLDEWMADFLRDV